MFKWLVKNCTKYSLFILYKNISNKNYMIAKLYAKDNNEVYSTNIK